MNLAYLNDFFSYSPLEQFDVTSFTFLVCSFVMNSLPRLTLSIFDSEYELLHTEILGATDSIFFSTSFGMGSVLLFVLFFWVLSFYPRTSIRFFVADFSFVSLLFWLNFMTLAWWFSYWFFPLTTFSYDFESGDLVPVTMYQHRSVGHFNENTISFLIAFFFLGGSEEEEDEDFILESRDSDLNADIIAGIFLANLGTHFKQTGALFVNVCTVFGFVVYNNVMGMLPYSDTATSSLILTFWVALGVFVTIVSLIILRQGLTFFFSLFLPAGAPVPLMLILVPIELVSYSFRVVSLAVRLFANMMAGHTLFKVLVGFSWTMILLGDILLLVNLFPILILIILGYLEFAIAIVQAYIFAVLTCMYMKDIYIGH